MNYLIVLRNVYFFIHTKVLVENGRPVSDRALHCCAQTNVVFVIVALDRNTVLFNQRLAEWQRKFIALNILIKKLKNNNLNLKILFLKKITLKVFLSFQMKSFLSFTRHM